MGYGKSKASIYKPPRPRPAVGPPNVKIRIVKLYKLVLTFEQIITKTLSFCIPCQGPPPPLPPPRPPPPPFAPPPPPRPLPLDAAEIAIEKKK